MPWMFHIAEIIYTVLTSEAHRLSGLSMTHAFLMPGAGLDVN